MGTRLSLHEGKKYFHATKLAMQYLQPQLEREFQLLSKAVAKSLTPDGLSKLLQFLSESGSSFANWRGFK